MVTEKTAAEVFEPLHAVPRPLARIGVTETVAIGVEDIRKAIAIQVGQTHAATAEILVGGAEQFFGGEFAAAVVLEEMNFFPLLGNERDDIEGAIAVQVGDANVD